tara:strand:+ start:2100 stop:2486 length:387 start_codon:yes stop_codon:yes gene_type:complete
MDTKQRVISTVVLLLADFAWLGLYMNNQYGTLVRTIQGDNMKANPVFAVLAYLLMIVGLNVFVLPNIRKGYELEDSLKYGMTFGIVLYGVYDFTAGAVFSKWDKKLAVIDVLWGGFVYFLASYLGSIL